MAHPLDGLLKTLENGDFNKDEKLAETSDLEVTQGVRKAMLANMLEGGNLPLPGSDEANFLITLLSTIDKQFVDKQKLDLESKRADIADDIKNLMIKYPGRLGSAQEIAKRIGGDPDESIVDIDVDKSVFSTFSFTSGELSNESPNLELTDVKKIVKNYQEKQIALASEGNNTSAEENQDT